MTEDCSRLARDGVVWEPGVLAMEHLASSSWAVSLPPGLCARVLGGDRRETGLDSLQLTLDVG